MDVMGQRKKIVKYIVDIFGGKPKFTRNWDDDRKSYIDMLYLENVPEEGVNFYSTIGTSEYSIGYKTDGLPLRVELVGVCDAKENIFINILATCALCIINSNFKCHPGAIFHDVVKIYLPNIDMQHVMFVPPFLWEGKLETINLEDKKVAWLLAVPISEKECIYAEKNGTNALEDFFEKEQIDIFNLYRKSLM